MCDLSSIFQWFDDGSELIVITNKTQENRIDLFVTIRSITCLALCSSFEASDINIMCVRAYYRICHEKTHFRKKEGRERSSVYCQIMLSFC